MANGQMVTVFRHVRNLVSAHSIHKQTDAALLHAFAAEHDQAAFTTLVKRHGSLVLAVCRRVLHNLHDAEDAFQATFILLARSADSIRKQESLASWLYGVAYRMANNARRAASRRRRHETGVKPTVTTRPDLDIGWREVQALLDEEIQRLPETYRAAFILCCLEDKTGTETARVLGIKEGTVRTRVTRARALLQQALSRRGVALPGVLAAVSISSNSVAATLPGSLVPSTVRAAAMLAAENVSPTDAISANVAALVKGAMKSMSPGRLKIATALTLVLAVAGIGVGISAGQKETAPPPEAEKPEDNGLRTASTARAALPWQGLGDERQVAVDGYGDPLPLNAVRRLGTVRFRHDTWLQAAVSPDGKVIAGSGNAEVRLWNAVTGKELLHFNLPGSVATPIAFSRDGKTLATGSSDEVVRLWDAANGKLLRVFVGHKGSPRDHFPGIQGVAFSPDGKILASRGSDRTVRLWEIATARQLHQFNTPSDPFPGSASGLAFSPDGNALVVGGNTDNTGDIVVWDTATGKELRRWRTPAALSSLAWSPDGKTIATGVADDAKTAGITVWDAAAGRELRHWLSDHKAAVFVAFSSDSKTLVSAADFTLRLWDAASGEEICRFPAPEPISSVTFLDDNKVLMSHGAANTLHFRDARTGKPVRRFAGHEAQVFDVTFSPDEKMVATAGGSDRSTGLWDAATGQEVRSLKEGNETSNVTAVSFSPDGKLLATANAEGIIRLWQPGTGKLFRRLELPRGWVRKVAFSADGKWLAADAEDKAVRVWDVSSGQEVRLWRADGGNNLIYTLAFSPDSKMLVVGGELPVRARDLATGKEVTLIEQSDRSVVTSLAFSADSRMLAAASADDTIRLWELASGQERLRIEHPGCVTSVAFSPDGRILASANSGNFRRSLAEKPQDFGTAGERVIRLWDVLTGKQVHQFEGHQGGCMSLAFSTSGKLLASCSKDTTALLWNVRAVLKEKQPNPGKLSKDEAQVLWADLASKDAARAYRAVGRMVEAPALGIPILRQRLRPVESAGAERVTRAMADLDSDQFSVREEATRQLEKLGPAAEPSLRQALKEGESPEVRRRVEQLLVRLEAATMTERRAIEVLERIGNPEALQLLKSLARGLPQSSQTREAKAAVTRLETDATVAPKPVR
jgi:RNA polymerase sigma factor (sigma-70 family)